MLVLEQTWFNYISFHTLLCDSLEDSVHWVEQSGVGGLNSEDHRKQNVLRRNRSVIITAHLELFSV